MVSNKMYNKIQMLKNKGFSKYRIGKDLNIDPASVRKYFLMSPESYRSYCEQTSSRTKVFDSFEGEILSLYESHGFQRLNMNAVYDFLLEKHSNLNASEKSLRNYIHYLEHTQKLTYSSSCRMTSKVPELPFGKQMQLDFGQKLQQNGLKLYIFCMLLSASRFRYVQFQGRPFSTSDVILLMLSAFDYFDGVPEEVVIDQDSLMVTSENLGDIQLTRQFKAFVDEMGFNLYVCRKADPQSKGKIENLVKFVKYNFLNVRTFETVSEANISVMKWLERRANGRVCQATGQIPNVAVIEERKHLNPIRNSIFRKNSYLNREKRMVSEKSFITIESNDYSVPTAYRSHEVEFFKTEAEIFVFDGKTGKEIAHHDRCRETGQKIVNRDHFRKKSTPLKDMRQEALSWLESSRWNLFLENNQKKFTRYQRDQLTALKLLIQESDDAEILEQALDLCLNCCTFSANDLKDTYQFMKKQNRLNQLYTETKQSHAVGGSWYFQPVSVNTRNIAEYESHVKGDCHESLH